MQEQAKEPALSIETAVKVAKVLATAPKERLPMILPIFRAAGLEIEGLDDLEEWNILGGRRGRDAYVDIAEIADELTGKYDRGEDPVKIPAKEFTAWCERKGLNAYEIRCALALKGYIRLTQKTAKGCTEVVRMDGKSVRCVLIHKEGAEK